MPLVIGNKGSFNSSRTVGFYPEINENRLTVHMLLGDGNGTTKVLVHEQEIEVDQKRNALFEGHAREIINYFSNQGEKNINLFKIGHQLEHVSILYSDPSIHPAVSAIIAASEGTEFAINQSSSNRSRSGGGSFKTAIRYHAVREWIVYEKSQWQIDATLLASNGVSWVKLGTLGKGAD